MTVSDGGNRRTLTTVMTSDPIYRAIIYTGMFVLDRR